MIVGKQAGSEVHAEAANLITPPELAQEKTEAINVLWELYDLLEMYSPQWYTEEYHRRAESLLQRFRKI
jgi:hypothetical protein